jgi:hypothetical protein
VLLSALANAGQLRTPTTTCAVTTTLLRLVSVPELAASEATRPTTAP